MFLEIMERSLDDAPADSPASTLVSVFYDWKAVCRDHLPLPSDHADRLASCDDLGCVRARAV